MRREILIILMMTLFPLWLSAQEEQVLSSDYGYTPEQPTQTAPATQPTQEYVYPQQQQEYVYPQQQQQQPQQQYVYQEQQQQPQQAEQQAEPEKKKQKKSAAEIFTGFSSGLTIHGGYLFSDSPDKLFSNNGLGSEDYVKGLPRSGVCMGIGAMFRVHFLDHIHLGVETNISTMPLMRTGSNLRNIWGGAHCDFYTTWGKVRPLIGMTVGGGTIKRLFVPEKAQIVTTPDSTVYNASYTSTPYFLLDPYAGLEILLGKSKSMALLIRIDYMLQFGTANGIAKDVNWSNFITPSGPRLYIGLLFGHMTKKKKESNTQ